MQFDGTRKTRGTAAREGGEERVEEGRLTRLGEDLEGLAILYSIIPSTKAANRPSQPRHKVRGRKGRGGKGENIREQFLSLPQSLHALPHQLPDLQLCVFPHLSELES